MIFHTKPMIRYYVRWAWIVILLICFAVTGVLAYHAITDLEGNTFTISRKVFTLPSLSQLFGLVVFPCGVLFLTYISYKEWAEKFFAVLKITETELQWRCIFRKNHKMFLSECKFIGVELENSFNELSYPFIYFSSVPYPKEYHHKVDKLPVSNQFIKFWYTDELAKYLLANFPNESVGGIKYYIQQQKPKKRKKCK